MLLLFRWMRVGRVLSIAICGVALLAGCADEDAEMQPPQVVQNISYITNVYGPATILSNAPVADATSKAGTSTSETAPAIAPVSSTAPHPDLDDAPIFGESTGVLECDRYLAVVSTCSRRIMLRVNADDHSFGRIDTALGTMRRSWASAAQNTSARPVLVRECKDSLDAYEAALDGQCD